MGCVLGGGGGREHDLYSHHSYMRSCQVNKNKQSIPTLSRDGTVANSDVDKANLLNSRHSLISHPQIQHQDTPVSSDCPEEILCCESEVCDIMLAALDMTKAGGPDGISG